MASHRAQERVPSQTKTFRAKRDAEAWARLTESAMERGLWQNQSEADSTTLSDALDRYGQEVSSGKKSGKIELYRIGTIKTDKIATLKPGRDSAHPHLPDPQPPMGGE